MKKMLMVMSLFITLIVSGCQCTLHTHYYSDYGVCSCGADIAQELTYSSGEYNSTIYSVNQGDTYYYKFTSHGENGIDFYLESESVKFDRIEIRAEGMLQTVPTRNDDTYKYYIGVVKADSYGHNTEKVVKGIWSVDFEHLKDRQIRTERK